MNFIQSSMTKKLIVLAVDWRLTKKKFWLQSELQQNGFNVKVIGIPNYDMRNRVVKWRKIILWTQYLVLGWRSVTSARRLDGVVISWNAIAGVFAAIISKKYGNRRPPIIALNLIAFKKSRIHNLLRRIIYQYAFNSDRVFITVNSSWLSDNYQTDFGIKPSKIFVINDPWDNVQEFFFPSRIDDNYVFSGGEAARDWETLISVARLCPEISFKIVARKKDWDNNRILPSNVQLFFDTGADEFYDLAKSSRIVLLTLNSNITAGLIVLKKSIILGRPVMITRTPSVIPYYPEQCEDLLIPMGDADNIAQKLRRLWINHEERIIRTKILQKHVLERFSPQSFVKQIVKLVEQIYY
jgi:glycosyltransferase involved in cell wall biosynthesis